MSVLFFITFMSKETYPNMQMRLKWIYSVDINSTILYFLFRYYTIMYTNNYIIYYSRSSPRWLMSLYLHDHLCWLSSIIGVARTLFHFLKIYLPLCRVLVSDLLHYNNSKDSFKVFRTIFVYSFFLSLETVKPREPPSSFSTLLIILFFY